MNDVDELDRIWRDGLASVAEELGSTSDPRVRVHARVQRRRRSRHAVVALVSIALVVSLVLAFSAFNGHSSRTRISNPPLDAVPTLVFVTDAPGGTLSLSFRHQVPSEKPFAVTLPSGVARFVIHGRAGHQLVSDGVPGFVANFEHTGIIVRDVRLAPGEYLMHCAVPGHAEAGEEAIFIVQ
jgi:hypothetical protein